MELHQEEPQALSISDIPQSRQYGTIAGSTASIWLVPDTDRKKPYRLIGALEGGLFALDLGG